MLHLAIATLLLAAPEEPKISYVKRVQIDPDYRPRMTPEEIERALAPRPRPRRVVRVQRVHYVERTPRYDYRPNPWHVAVDVGIWGAWWWGWHHHWHHCH